MITTPRHITPFRYRATRDWRVAAKSATARAARWLAADPRDVLSFAPQAPRRETAGSAPRPEAVRAALASWRRRVVWHRAPALARRYVLLGLALMCCCALGSRLAAGLVPWWMLAIPAAVALCTALVALRRPLSLEAVARLLDRELALHEQTASALEVDEGRARGTNSLLSAHLEQRALAALATAQGAWRVRRTPAAGEWAGIAALAVALALLLVAPHWSTGGGTAARTRAPVVAAAPAPSRGALAVPPISAQAHLPVHVSAAVVSTPTARQTAAAAKGRTQSKSQHLVTSRSRSGAPTPVGAHASGSSRQATSSGQSGIRIPGTQSPGGARSGTQGSSLSVLKGNRRGVVPSSKGASGAPRRSAPAGQAHGGASVTGAHAAARAGSGSSASTGQQNAGSPSGGMPPGAQALPYGGGLHLTPSQLPKPGLITGKGAFQGKGSPGGNSAGHERGSTGGQNAAHPALPNTKGRQFNLQSGYGGQGAHTMQPAPGQSGATGGRSTAAAGTGQAGLPVIDYVPADTDAVAPPDRSIVTHYFVARASQQ